MKSIRIPELDLLRFLAALAVVFFHYAFRGHAADGLTGMSYPALEPVAQYGFLGVHLFFMISGFVILMTAGEARFGKFVASRAARLLPAFWACCTVTFLVTLAIGGERFTASWTQYAVNLLRLGGGFGLQPVDGAYWSLGTELRFYLLVGIVLLVGQIHRAERWLFVWLIGVVLVDLFPFIKLKGFLITDYAGLFIGGAACYLMRQHGPSRSRLLLVGAAWMLSLFQEHLLLASFNENFGTGIRLGVVGAVMSVFFAVMLGLALRRAPLLGGTRWVWFGAISYPLYLIHQNVGYMLFNAAPPSIDRTLLFWAVLLLAIGFALGVHVAVEKPLAGPMKRVLLRGFDALQSRLALRRAGTSRRP